MNATTPTPPLVLRLPLSGVFLVEASAGTGKTFTLTAWMLRLLLEAGVPLPQMLAVTFTRAATAELRERVRRRLRTAERLLQGAAPDNEEGRQTAAVIAQALASGIDPDTLQMRLQAALLQLDEAAVSTIHGFCQRALREFGFLAGALNDDSVIDQPAEVWSEVAADLWRSASVGDAAGFATLRALWATPEALAKQLPRLCDAARQLLPVAQASAMAAWLHGLRADASLRFERALAERRQRTQDQLIEQVWRASAHPPFAAALRQRWPVVLVDEFQDTEPRQWDIFRRMFEAAVEDGPGSNKAGLFLIGDPKQAIYRFRGGDLPTYLQARAYARQHGGEASLDTNYRSRPSVLRAIETLFTASAVPFRDPEIAFPAVHAAEGSDDAALEIGEEIAAGLTVHLLPPAAGGKTRRLKPEDEASAIAACVAQIVRLLDDGTLTDRHGRRRVRPGDIAVLVRQNKQIGSMRDALARAGIAAACQSNDSVFASQAARELHALLLAMAAPSEPGRVRAALATQLLGLGAASIAAFDADPAALQSWQARFEQAGALWQARGPLPAVLPLLSEASQSRLAEHGGARLMTDALHLAELLQAEAPAQHGVHGLLRWFGRHCDDPPEHDDLALRLDGDAQAVQLVTLHKSKGLEYPVVLLPFAAFSSGGGSSGGVRFVQATDAQGQPAYYACKTVGSGKQREVVLGSDDHDACMARDEAAESAEDLRLLYVGLTRAQYALHLVWGRTHDSNATALQWLLHDGAKAGRKSDPLQPAGMRERVAQLASSSQGAIVLREIDDAAPPPVRANPDTDTDAVPEARVAQRVLRMRGGQYSFSGLRARHSQTLPARGADDEVAAAAADAPDLVAAGIEPEAGLLLRGAEFGNAVHDVLEATDFSLWRDAHAAPTQALRSLQQALQRRGLPQTPAAQAQLAALVSRALNVPLPGIASLSELDPSQRIAEMEFHFRLGATRLPELYALLEQYGYPRLHTRLRQGEVEGLMHGYVDLIYRDRDGLHHVLDYKTNLLRDYAPASCAAAVREHDYDLQYLIYLVALQRWLRLRFGAGYRPDRHLGGAVYLFLRGLRPAAADAASVGLHIDRPPQALIDALDALFDGRQPERRQVDASPFDAPPFEAAPFEGQQLDLLGGRP